MYMTRKIGSLQNTKNHKKFNHLIDKSLKDSFYESTVEKDF